MGVLAIGQDALEHRVSENYAWFGYVEGEPTHYIATPEYKEVFEKFAQDGAAALRTAQFRTAIQKENVTMQIWLGKQMLNQKDYPSDVNTTDEVTVEFDIMKALYRKGINDRKNTPV
jgi:hypothetical protein